MMRPATRLGDLLKGGWRYGVVGCLVTASASASLLLAPTASRAVMHDPQAAMAGPAGTMQSLIAITENATPLVANIDAARAANEALPLVAGALQSADPFNLPDWVGLSTADRAQQCLALAMYYEAAYEGSAGRRAVAQVVLNRVRHPAFPNDVCSVVFQRSTGNVCQFTFACDGAMRRPRDPLLWRQTMSEAGAALHGAVYAEVGMATHYHANYVFPYWAPRLEKVAVIGAHVFYRWPNGWGKRAVFTDPYAGRELMPALPETAEVLAELPPPIAVPAELQQYAAEPVPARVEVDGGYVDTSKGWTPRTALPRERPAASSSPSPQL
jgi:spore germination cell wall hydrolase CwlJ-like protein